MALCEALNKAGVMPDEVVEGSIVEDRGSWARAELVEAAQGVLHRVQIVERHLYEFAEGILGEEQFGESVVAGFHRQAGMARRMAWGKTMLKMALGRLMPMARAAII